MRVSIVASVVLVVVLAGSVPGAAAAASTATASEPTSAPQPQETRSAVDDGSMFGATEPTQEIRINVTENGDAVWTIESRFRLSDEEEVEAFLEYAETVSGDEREGIYDRSLFEPHVETAADATDREMAIEDAGWDDPQLRSVDDGSNESGSTIGVLSYSFTWTGFAAVDGTRIHVGSAFQGDDGPWLSALAGDQRLVIQAPSNHGFHDYNLPVSPQDSALVVDGPYQFDEGELEVTFLRGAGDGSTGGAGGFVPGSSELLLGGLFVLAVLVGAGSYALARRSAESERSPALWIAGLLPSNAGERTDGRSSPTERNDPSTASGREAEPGGVEADVPRGSNVDLDSAPRDAAGQAFAYVEDSEEEAVDPELLSDEERVLRLLRRSGGRMKQGSIVSETGWSNAKVSQLLSQMSDDDEIEKLRIGRENLITLPEVDPTELD